MPNEVFILRHGREHFDFLPRTYVLPEDAEELKDVMRNSDRSSYLASWMIKVFWYTRPKPAYGRQGLDWIVGPGYSFVVFSTNKTMETNHKP